MKKILKRLRSQKGISGVLVALLLVVVGVGLVAGLNTYLDQRKADIEKAADDAFTEANVTTTTIP